MRLPTLYGMRSLYLHILTISCLLLSLHGVAQSRQKAHLRPAVSKIQATLTALITEWKAGLSVEWSTVQVVQDSLFFVSRIPKKDTAGYYYQVQEFQPTGTSNRFKLNSKGPRFSNYPDLIVRSEATGTCLRVLQANTLWCCCAGLSQQLPLMLVDDYGGPVFDDYGLTTGQDSAGKHYYTTCNQIRVTPDDSVPAGDKVVQRLGKVNSAGLAVVSMGPANQQASTAKQVNCLWVYDFINRKFLDKEVNDSAVFLTSYLLKLHSATNSTWRFLRVDSARRVVLPVAGPSHFRRIDTLNTFGIPAVTAWHYAAIGIDSTLHWYTTTLDILQLGQREVLGHRWLPGGAEAVVQTARGWQRYKLPAQSTGRPAAVGRPWLTAIFWPLTSKWFLYQPKPGDSLCIRSFTGQDSLRTAIPDAADSLLISCSQLGRVEIVRICWREGRGPARQLHAAIYRCSATATTLLKSLQTHQFFPFESLLFTYGEIGAPGAAFRVWQWNELQVDEHAVPIAYEMYMTKPLELPAGSGDHYWLGQRLLNKTQCLLELNSSGQLVEYQQKKSLDPLVIPSLPASERPSRSRSSAHRP